MAVPLAIGAAGLAGRAGIATGRLGQIAQASNLLNGLNKTMPRMEEEMDVRVWGGPASTRLRLYRLAMALVWGKIQRRDLVRLISPPGLLMLEYNLESNSVRVFCRIVTTYTASLLGRLRGRRKIELFEGPPEISIGGEWAFTSVLPNVGFVGIQEENGFEGRTILTPEPMYEDDIFGSKVSRSPTPPGDRLSRGLATVAGSPQVQRADPVNWNRTPAYLLWAALSEPCASRNFNIPVYTPAPLKPDPAPAPGYPPPTPPFAQPALPTQLVVPPTGSSSQQPKQVSFNDDVAPDPQA